MSDFIAAGDGAPMALPASRRATNIRIVTIQTKEAWPQQKEGCDGGEKGISLPPERSNQRRAPFFRTPDTRARDDARSRPFRFLIS